MHTFKYAIVVFGARINIIPELIFANQPTTFLKAKATLDFFEVSMIILLGKVGFI